MNTTIPTISKELAHTMFIDKSTNPTTGALWKKTHDPREPYLTGTNVAEVLGIGYSSRKMTWAVIAGIQEAREPSEFVKNVLFKPGIENEPKAINSMKRLLKTHGDYIYACPGTLVHPTNPHFLVSMDFIAVQIDTGKLLNIEIKCPVSRLPGGLNANKATGTKGVLSGRICQILMQMHCTGGAIRSTVLFHWLSDTEWEAYLFQYDRELAELLFTDATSLKTVLMRGKFAHQDLMDYWNRAPAFYHDLLNKYKNNTQFCTPLPYFDLSE